PQPWIELDRKKPPEVPYLATKMAVLQRMSLLGDITPEEQRTLAELVAESKKPRQPKLGEEFKLGDFTYTVKKVTTFSAIGSGFAEKRASDGARFVVVEYTIRNDGKT